MAARKATDEQLIEAIARHGGSVALVAREFGVSDRAVYTRLGTIEHRIGRDLRAEARAKARVTLTRDTRPNPIELVDGTVLVCSDCHYWPGDVSTGHRALLAVGKMLSPQVVVVNGDEFDGAAISRHGRIGWEQRPTVSKELEACRDRLEEIRSATPGAKHLGTFGNHTLRFDTYLSTHAAQLEDVPGLRYEDMFPSWHYAWAWVINGHTLVKHRAKNGIHATWNNTADSQISTVTGHLHNLRVTPRSTMSPLNGGTIYGVDTGMLADPWGPQFAYLEQGPRNWRSGFVVLTFVGGQLMPPEIVQVVEEGKAFFRGQILEV